MENQFNATFQLKSGASVTVNLWNNKLSLQVTSKDYGTTQHTSAEFSLTDLDQLQALITTARSLMQPEEPR